MPCISQLPRAIVELILGELSASDIAQLRLTCVAWRDLRPARDFRHRVTLGILPGWKKYAAQLRSLCPNITVVIHCDGLQNLAQLLQSPECDIVSCFPQGLSIMPQWTLQTGTYVQNTSGRALRELQELAAIAEHSDPLVKPRLELGLRTRSNQVVLPLVKAALFGMKSMIREIREQQQFIATLEVLFPLENLKVLATSLPGRPREPDIFQAAVRLAPNLEFLQLYVQTHNATVSALRFLTVLAELPKVTSLRLVTNGNAACLLPSYLMHITYLELGRRVYFRQVPPKLRELCLEGLDLDYLGCRQNKKWESELLCLDCHTFSWRSYSDPDFMTPEQYQKQYWQQQAKAKA